jgi:DNA-binding GntR family transcriptional regulator
MKIKNHKKSGTSFSNKAYSLLKENILSLKFSPEEPLSESKLSALLGMSRTPVREALKRLKTEGFINSFDKKGHFINIPTINQVKNIYEIRAILEGGAAKLAASKIDLNMLREFEKKFTLWRNKLRDKTTNENNKKEKLSDLKLGRQFHFFIISSAGNEKLEQLIMNIYDQLEISRPFSYTHRHKEEVAEEHLKILNALKERDEEKCRTYMEEHIKNAFNTLVRIL